MTIDVYKQRYVLYINHVQNHKLHFQKPLQLNKPCLIKSKQIDNYKIDLLQSVWTY